MDLYLDSPGDDTTVAVVHAVKSKHVNIFTGPPQSYDDDAVLMRDFMTVSRKKDRQRRHKRQYCSAYIKKEDRCFA